MHGATLSWILRLPTKSVGILRMTQTLLFVCHPEPAVVWREKGLEGAGDLCNTIFVLDSPLRCPDSSLRFAPFRQ